MPKAKESSFTAARKWADEHQTAATFLVLFGLMLAILLVGWGIRRIKYSSFDDHMRDYVAAPSPSVSGRTAYVTGKVVAVDTEDRSVDEGVQELLADEIRARNPGEVGTVVWVACQNEPVGEYSGGAKATQSVCKVTIIDERIGAMLSEQTFSGPKPPVIAKSNELTGARPTQAIASFIEQLPRQ